jgi:ATP-dependent Clp protease protease subunit
METRRTVMLGPLHDASVAQVVSLLLQLEREAPTAEVTLMINTSGGSLEAGLAIHDVMKGLACPLRTVCLGRASGVAALLVASGSPGRRDASPHATIQLVQPSAAGDEREQVKQWHAFAELLASATGQSVAKMTRDLAASRTFDAAQARDHGFIDQVVLRR